MGRYDQSRFLFSARTIFSMAVTVRNVYEAETTKELIVAAIGVGRYRLRNGKVPESLGQLREHGVAQPLDPMDGQALRYAAKGTNDFLLYSAGYNGVDDGGDAAAEREEGTGIWRGLDVVWPRAN